MKRTITDREHVRKGRAAHGIDPYAVCAYCPRGEKGLDRRNNTDPDDHHFAANDLTVCEAHARCATAHAFDAFDHRVQSNIDAVRAVLGLVKARQFLAGNACQHARERLEHRHLLAQLAQHGCGFKSDVAATNHHNACRRPQLSDHPIDIGATAYRMNAGQVVTLAAQPSCMPACCPDQAVIANAFTVLRGDDMGDRIDRNNSLPCEHGHVALSPKGCGSDQDAIEFLVASQIVFRQWRPLVRNLGLFAGHPDRSCEAALAQCDRCLRTAMPGPHDEDVIPYRHKRSPGYEDGAGVAASNASP